MAAVVHHGGAGTTAIGLMAGVPSVITPLIYDQRFWAWRVENIGAGPKPIGWNQLTIDNLTAAIETALHDNTIEQKTKDIANKINEENGVDEAVKLFNTYYNHGAGKT
jgi:UDP:flavonoid glycosyltransferase YjiC (YdhE family)